MKNIFLLLLLITGMVEAQIVDIPDANFKAYLLSANTATNQFAVDQFNNYIVIDANSDGEIQNAEAQAVYSLTIENNTLIQSIEGISSFANLRNVDINHISPLNAINLSGLSNLIDVFIDWNENLQLVNLSGLSNLTNLHCTQNFLLSTINLSGLNNLVTFIGFLNGFTSLDFSDLDSVTTIDCYFNQFSTLNVSGLHQLTSIKFMSFNLTTVNLIDLPLLSTIQGSFLEAGNTNITDVTIVDCPLLSEQVIIQSNDLVSFTCSNSGVTDVDLFLNSQLTTINVAGLSSLETLRCGGYLSTLDLSGCTSLRSIYSNGSIGLSTIDLSDCQSLESVIIPGSTLLTELDLTMAPNLQVLDLFNCQQLKRLFIKNGSNESLNFDFCGALEFVCADDSQINSIYLYFIDINLVDQAVVNSYCFFVPGGNYNTITGNIRLDNNNDGCDLADFTFPFTRVDINSGTSNGADFTRLNGNYVFYTQAGSFDITPSIENASWFNFSPATATVNFADNNNNITTEDFCITANGIHPDIEVVISPVFFARPGFDATYQITYRNKGNQTVSGTINLIFDDVRTDFVSANPAVDNLAVNSLSWDYSNLLPFESRTITVVFNVNGPMEIPAVNIGDILTFQATISSLDVDENPQDNSFTLDQIVVGSYDPNNIICLEGDVVPSTEIGNYLHYAINFENTGTFPAENVVVKTEIDVAKFDIASLQLMNSNFPVDARITGNKVEFIFENIQLPIGGHGHILLKIKTQNTLVIGDVVANRGDIFFDYNFPIDTGLANTVFQTLSNSVFEIDSSIVVYPNPAVNEVTITADNKIKSIQLYDAQGRIVLTRMQEDLESKLDISNHSKGIYFIKIITEKGAQVQKLIKE